MIFIINHHIINKFIIIKTFIKKNDSMLFKNNIKAFSEASLFFCSDVKHVRQTLTKQSHQDKDKQLNDIIIMKNEEIFSRKTSKEISFLEVSY